MTDKLFTFKCRDGDLTVRLEDALMSQLAKNYVEDHKEPGNIAMDLPLFTKDEIYHALKEHMPKAEDYLMMPKTLTRHDFVKMKEEDKVNLIKSIKYKERWKEDKENHIRFNVDITMNGHARNFTFISMKDSSEVGYPEDYIIMYYYATSLEQSREVLNGGKEIKKNAYENKYKQDFQHKIEKIIPMFIDSLIEKCTEAISCLFEYESIRKIIDGEDSFVNCFFPTASHNGNRNT